MQMQALHGSLNVGIGGHSQPCSTSSLTSIDHRLTGHHLAVEPEQNGSLLSLKPFIKPELGVFTTTAINGSAATESKENNNKGATPSTNLVTEFSTTIPDHTNSNYWQFYPTTSVLKTSIDHQTTARDSIGTSDFGWRQQIPLDSSTIASFAVPNDTYKDPLCINPFTPAVPNGTNQNHLTHCNWLDFTNGQQAHHPLSATTATAGGSQFQVNFPIGTEYLMSCQDMLQQHFPNCSTNGLIDAIHDNHQHVS